MDDNPADVNMRCSVVVFRDNSVLLVRRSRDEGADDWVLPGGTPRPGESMSACAEREAAEETGLSLVTGRVAFILETMGPGAQRRTVDLVFAATATAGREPESPEPGLTATFVPLRDLPVTRLRPPIAGYVRALHSQGGTRTAAYLGNLWRPAHGTPVPAGSD